MNDLHPSLADDNIQGTKAPYRAQVLMGRYRVLGGLGRGRMGEVLHVLDLTSGVEFALKRIPSDGASGTGRVEDLRGSFARVCHLAHPGIANYKFIERDPSTGEYLLLMEFVPGISLAKWVQKKGGRLSEDETRRLLGQVAAALDHAHLAGVVHCDVKPSNILVTPDEVVKVIDFGLAAAADPGASGGAGLPGDDMAGGSPPYMAPELWRARKPVAATDQWALACTAYECLAGDVPFPAQDLDALRQSVLGEAPDPVAGISPGLAEGLRRALAKDPAKRWPDCRSIFQPTADKSAQGHAPADTAAGQEPLAEHSQTPGAPPAAAHTASGSVPGVQETVGQAWIPPLENGEAAPSTALGVFEVLRSGRKPVLGAGRRRGRGTVPTEAAYEADPSAAHPPFAPTLKFAVVLAMLVAAFPGLPTYFAGGLGAGRWFLVPAVLVGLTAILAASTRVILTKARERHLGGWSTATWYWAGTAMVLAAAASGVGSRLDDKTWWNSTSLSFGAGSFCLVLTYWATVLVGRMFSPDGRPRGLALWVVILGTLGVTTLALLRTGWALLLGDIFGSETSKTMTILILFGVVVAHVAIPWFLWWLPPRLARWLPARFVRR